VRLVKLFGLAAIAAVALVAYMASAASADTLCEENTTGECPAAKRVTVGTNVVGLSVGTKSALLLGASGSIEEECNSEVLGKVTTTGGGKPVLGEVTKLVFTSCSGLCKKATGQNLPFKLEGVAAEAMAYTSAGASKKTPGAILEECFLVGSCKYEILEAKQLFKVVTDTLIGEKIGLKREGASFCPEKGFFDVTYLLTLDNETHTGPLFLVAKP
jgi:hypothetical protein